MTVSPPDDALTTSARAFQERLGWPVTPDPSNDRLVSRTGEHFDALLMPDRLTARLVPALSTVLMTGPIACRSGWCTVVTQVRPRSIDLPPELHAARVHAVPQGGQVILPPLSQRDAWWQLPLPGRSLPPHHAVVSTLRQVIGGYR